MGLQTDKKNDKGMAHNAMPPQKLAKRSQRKGLVAFEKKLEFLPKLLRNNFFTWYRMATYCIICAFWFIRQFNITFIQHL